jgi:hypothetical protein
MTDAAVQHFIDRQNILDCLIRFSRGMDRLDRELALSAFHPDAVCDYGPYVGDAAGLFDWAMMQKSNLVFTHHSLSNHSCEIDGDVAHSETYLFYIARRMDESNWQANGRYIDRLEQRNGTWRIAMRYCVVEGMHQTAKCELPFVGIADLDDNGKPGYERAEDPSYRRPLTNRRKLRAIA